jgi:hypothetical protein
MNFSFVNELSDDWFVRWNARKHASFFQITFHVMKDSIAYKERNIRITLLPEGTKSKIDVEARREWLAQEEWEAPCGASSALVGEAVNQRWMEDHLVLWKVILLRGQSPIRMM